jgi:hypothetical protein
MLPRQPNAVGHYKPQLHVLTLATDLNKPELDHLISSAEVHGLRVTVLQPSFDMRGHWGSRFGIKLQLVTNFANMIPDDDLLMIVDGYDTVFTGNTSSIVDGFYQATQGRDIFLASAETNVYPEPNLRSLYPAGPTRYMFL